MHAASLSEIPEKTIKGRSSRATGSPLGLEDIYTTPASLTARGFRLAHCGEHLDRKESHAVFAVEKLKLALDHNIERFKEQLVEVGLHLLLGFLLLKFFKLLGTPP